MELSKDELSEIIKEAVGQSRIKGDVHSSHHEFVEMLIDREDRKNRRVEKFKMSIIGTIGTAVVAGLAWLGRLIWDHVMHGGGS